MECGKKLNIHYENGTILRAEALNRQANETENIRRYLYSDYPDGIVTGFSLCKSSSGKYFFSEGLLKLDGGIYILEKFTEDEIYLVRDKENNEIETDCIYYLCICKSEKRRNCYEGKEKSPVTEGFVRMVALKKSEINSGDVIIVASYMKSASNIIFAENFEDYRKNRFSTLNGDYSIAGGKAVSSDFTEIIRKEIEMKPFRDYLDVSLYMNCVQNNRLSRKALIFYCSCKLNREVEWNEIIDLLDKAMKINANPVAVASDNRIVSATKHKDEFDHYL